MCWYIFTAGADPLPIHDKNCSNDIVLVMAGCFFVVYVYLLFCVYVFVRICKKLEFIPIRRRKTNLIVNACFSTIERSPNGMYVCVCMFQIQILMSIYSNAMTIGNT